MDPATADPATRVSPPARRPGSIGTRRRRHLANWLWGSAFALPAVAVLVVFLGYPLASIVYHAFTTWDGYSPPTWIGIGNLQMLINDPLLALALRNNLLF